MRRWQPSTRSLLRVVTIIAIFMLTPILWLGHFSQPEKAAAADPVQVESSASSVWTVKHGDTLWTIAKTIAPASKDPRTVVQDIQMLNADQLESALIYPGQMLKIPTYN